MRRGSLNSSARVQAATRSENRERIRPMSVSSSAPDKAAERRASYPAMPGVVEEGALADLLLIDGNPLENIKLVAEPDKNFLVNVKNGTIYKNTVSK